MCMMKPIVDLLLRWLRCRLFFSDAKVHCFSASCKRVLRQSRWLKIQCADFQFVSRFHRPVLSRWYLIVVVSFDKLYLLLEGCFVDSLCFQL